MSQQDNTHAYANTSCRLFKNTNCFLLTEAEQNWSGARQRADQKPDGAADEHKRTNYVMPAITSKSVTPLTLRC